MQNYFLIILNAKNDLFFNTDLTLAQKDPAKFLEGNILDFYTVSHRRDFANRVSPFSSAKPLFVFK